MTTIDPNSAQAALLKVRNWKQTEAEKAKSETVNPIFYDRDDAIAKSRSVCTNG